jgi:uncharacterized surface protein with fasciclin (FAS1) repeats
MTLTEKRLSMQDILETAAEAGSFRTFVAGVRSTHLNSVLQYTRCLTLLAPTDDAFASLPAEMIRHLLEPDHREEMGQLILGHILVDLLCVQDLARRESIVSLGDRKLDIQPRDGKVRIAGASILCGDIVASNGIIHVIDKVLVPCEWKQQSDWNEA